MAYISCGLAFAPQERAIWLASGLEHRGIATSLDPLDATAHALFGHGLLLAGKHEAALKETTQAVVLNPSNATVENLHAVVLT